MSRFADKLRSLSKSSSAPIGFHPAASEVRSPSMLLIVWLSETQSKEARTVADIAADAGLIVSEGTGAKTVRQFVEAVGDVPLGVFVKGMREKEIDELVSLGCDFAVFDIGGAAAILSKKEVGKFVMIEPSLDQGLVRAINSFEVDGVLISGAGGSVMTMERMLACRRIVELLEKPVIVALPSLATKEELTSLWQAGVDGVVSASTQSTEALAELKRTLGDLPRRARNRRTTTGVVLPRYGGDAVDEEDEQQERIKP
jgi:hypothetical protein